MRQTPPQPRLIRVAIRVADRTVRERMTRVLAEAGNFAPAGFGDADVTIADGPADVGSPVIALVPLTEAASWRSDVRAALPPDIDAPTLGAVITVIAAGLSVAPPDRARGAGTLLDSWPDTRTGDWVGIWAEALDPLGAEDEEHAVMLTPREREVLALLASGASNKAIAHALDLSVHTVKFHVASLIEKLGAGSRLEAVAIAIRTGLIMM